MEASGTAAVRVRPATAADAEAVVEIYNHGIAERTATFETRPRSREEVLAWLSEGLPFLVAVGEDGGVVGFARVSRCSVREVYAGVGEHGVYVGSDARGAGIGRRLLEELAATAEAAGFYKLTSRIFADNEASVATHRAAGFDVVGLQRRHGRLEGRWRDCVLVERLLGEAAHDL